MGSAWVLCSFVTQLRIHALSRCTPFTHSFTGSYTVTDSLCLLCFSASSISLHLFCSFLRLCISVSPLSVYFCLLSLSPSLTLTNSYPPSEHCDIQLGALVDTCFGGRRSGDREGQPPSCPPLWPHHPLSSAQSDRGEYRTEDGLVKGHAYSVTGTHKVSIPYGWAGKGCPGAIPTDDAALRCHWDSPKCGCCGCGTRGAAWSGPGPGVTGGMHRGGGGSSAPPAGPSHPGLPSCPRWDALPAEWRDALLVKKEDGEFW